MTAPEHYPVADLVAVAWAQSLPGVPSNSVAGTLPPLIRDGVPAAWADTGFITALAIDPGPLPTAPLWRSVVQFDSYAGAVRTYPDGSAEVSNKPPWNVANALAVHLVRGCWGYAFHGSSGQPLTLRGNHAAATVMDARVLSGPRKVPGDPGNLARFTMDVQLLWLSTTEGREAP